MLESASVHSNPRQSLMTPGQTPTVPSPPKKARVPKNPGDESDIGQNQERRRRFQNRKPSNPARLIAPTVDGSGIGFGISVTVKSQSEA